MGLLAATSVVAAFAVAEAAVADAAVAEVWAEAAVTRAPPPVETVWPGEGAGGYLQYRYGVRWHGAGLTCAGFLNRRQRGLYIRRVTRRAYAVAEVVDQRLVTAQAAAVGCGALCLAGDGLY